VDAGQIERFVRGVALGKTAKDEKVRARVSVIVRGGEGAAPQTLIGATSITHGARF
jgi:hypothetical protein